MKKKIAIVKANMRYKHFKFDNKVNKQVIKRERGKEREEEERERRLCKMSDDIDQNYQFATVSRFFQSIPLCVPSFCAM